MKHCLLSCRKLVSWIQNRWYLKFTQSFSWVLLEVFLCEDLFNLFIEIKVSDLVGVLWVSITIF